MILYDILVAAIAADLPFFRSLSGSNQKRWGQWCRWARWPSWLGTPRWQGSVKHRFSGLNGGFLWFPKIGDTPRSKFGWFIFIYLYYIYMVYTYIYIYRYTPSFWVCFCLIFRWIIPSSNGLWSRSPWEHGHLEGFASFSDKPKLMFLIGE